MINKARKCGNINCENMIFDGRSNKIYCCDKCRSRSFQLNNYDTIYKERAVIKGIRENDKVLEKLFERFEKSIEYPNCIELSITTLKGAGYNTSYNAYTGSCKIGDKNPVSFFQLKFKLIGHPTLENHYFLCKIQ